MKRTCGEYSFAREELKNLKEKMLRLASGFSIFVWLDSNGYEDKHGRYDCVLGISDSGFRIPDFGAADCGLPSADWRFGHLCYDYKNVLEPGLASRHAALTGFEECGFFVPDIVCYVRRGGDVLHIESLTAAPDDVWSRIASAGIAAENLLPQISFKQRIGREEYLQKINRLRQHIYEGDCYEINFCNEAFAADVSLDPLAAYRALNAASPAPFSAFYKNGDSYLMCASPERFITKRLSKIISQPIKGTARRGATIIEDESLKAALLASEKERAENVMIVDLVRNDLARSCKAGSITVEELFGIYTYPQVHQMISTVSGELRDDHTIVDALLKAFPMGSMTGVPKYRVMQLIEDYEEARRELFSGTVGYISPGGDADFNVVIRSLFYNADTRRLSYQTGGAITWDSTPEGEWEEMRLKAAAMERIFSSKS